MCSRSELTCHKKHGYSAAPSKWFTWVREQLGFRDDAAKRTFTAFTIPWLTTSNKKGLLSHLSVACWGIWPGGITFGRYGKDFMPDVLAPVIELVTLVSF